MQNSFDLSTMIEKIKGPNIVLVLNWIYYLAEQYSKINGII